MSRLFTHQSPDLDAIFSIIAAKKYIPNMFNAKIEFRPANWDGVEMEKEDIAVDIEAGGKGIKGEKETKENGNIVVHSCFSQIMNKFAPKEDKEALKYLIAYVDLQDSRGSVIKQLAPNIEKEANQILYFSGLSSILRCLQAVHRNDLIVYARFREIFNGQLINGRNRLRAEKLIEKAEAFGENVALTVNLPSSTHSILFEKGFSVIVFVDGSNLGIRRENDCEFRCDRPEIRKFIESFGEPIGNAKDHWYPHPSGFLFARGTSKAPASCISKVPPRELAKLVQKLIGS